MPRPVPTQRQLLTSAAQRQDAVLSRRQLRELGHDDNAIRAQLAAGRWQLSGRVVVLHNGPLTTAQRRWCAVLSHDLAALAGVTAAAELGLTGFDEETVHIVV